MTKKEQYQELKRAGVKLRAINTLRAEEVAAMYHEMFGGESATVQSASATTPPCKATAEKPGTEKRIPVLYFDHGGWCEELKTSYCRGYHQPASWEEYRCLQPHAAGSMKG